MLCAQPNPLLHAKFGEGWVATRTRQLGELPEHFAQEEAQPDALALALHPHQVHAVVPVAGTDQRQAVLAELQSTPDGPHAVLVQAGHVGGPAGQIVVGVVLRVDRAAFQEGHGFIQHAGVPGARHIAAHRQRQPEVVVRTMRAHAPARGRMPPVLDISLLELTARAQQQVLAHQPGLGVDERHHVLQLVAEAEGTARLIVAAACPDTTREGLVHQPAVGQHIDRRVGCFHLHRAERVIPVMPHCFERTARRQRSAEALHELAGLIGVAPDAEPEDDVAFLTVGQIKTHLDRGAGIQAGTHLAGKARPIHSGRIAQRAIAPEEFRAVAAQGPRRIIYVEEGNPIGELHAVRVSRVERTAPGVDFGSYMHGRFRTKIPQYPLDVPRRGEPSRSA